MRKDIRDPLATMKDLFVSFRFIEPSSDNLRLKIMLYRLCFSHLSCLYITFKTLVRMLNKCQGCARGWKLCIVQYFN